MVEVILHLVVLRQAQQVAVLHVEEILRLWRENQNHATRSVSAKMRV